MADSAGHDQATVREVQVTVQGAKHVEGTEQRQIFTETTKTTIVFGNGAVVNLNSKVAPGQCVFLRNDQTGREILCKVLEWRQVAESGYVDLEFTTRDPQFWDAPAAQPAAPAAATKPAEAPEEEKVLPITAQNPGAAPSVESSAPADEETARSDAQTAAAAEQRANRLSEMMDELPEVEEEAERNDTKDAELLAKLIATDAKRKPKRESAAAETKASAEEAAAETAPEQAETIASAEVANEGAGENEHESEAPATAARASWIRGLHKYTYGKNAIRVGIAASVLIVATLGFVWHAKQRAGIRNKNQAAAVIAQAKQNALNTAAPSPTTTGAASGPAPASAASTNPGTGAGTNTAAATGNAGPDVEAPAHGNNSGATPAQAAQKIQQQTGAANAGAAVANNATASVTSSSAPAAPPAAAPKLEASESAPDDNQEAAGQTKHHHGKGPNGGETIPARIVAQPPPAIPPWAKGLDTDGVVKLDALIDEKGNVRETKALSGPRLLQHEAERAVALWIFEPALTDGKPTATHMVLTVQFQR